MALLLSRTVQRLWQVKDRQIIAYGYAPMLDNVERLTYVIWFEAGSLHRAGYTFQGVVKEYTVHKMFQPHYFTNNIKRWYRNSIPPIVGDYFETFGSTLSVVDGGKPPDEPPDVTNVVPDSIDGVPVSK